MSDHSPASPVESWIETDNRPMPDDPGQGRAPWIPEHIQGDAYVAAVRYHAGLVNDGHTEYMAQLKTKAVFFPDLPATDPVPAGDQDEEEDITPDRTPMPAAVKIAFAFAALAAVAWFAYDNLTHRDPLDQAISAREQAARAYAKSHPARIALDKQDDLNKAAYEKAYKREACLINGTCK